MSVSLTKKHANIKNYKITKLASCPSAGWSCSAWLEASPICGSKTEKKKKNESGGLL